MTSSTRSWRAYARPAETGNPLHDLVEQLLQLLLNDVPTGRDAELTVRPSASDGTSADPQQGRYAQVSRSDSEPGREVSASATLPNGHTATLAIRGELMDDAPTQAQLRRFLGPLTACVALQTRLDELSGHARGAVAEIERRAITDLATGIVMARRDCDPATAGELLTAWSARTGFDLSTMSATRSLALLVADPP